MYITKMLAREHGLREGTLLRVRQGAVTLRGERSARLFRRGERPLEAPPGTDLTIAVAGAGR